MTPDEKLNWIIEQGVIFDEILSKEVELVLKVAYSRAGNKVKELLLREISKGPADKDDKTRSKHMVHSRLRLLKEIAPDCRQVDDTLQLFLSDNPDIEARVSQKEEIVKITPDQLLTLNVSDAIDQILEKMNLSYEEPEFSEPTQILEAAVSKNPDWALRLLVELGKREGTRKNILWKSAVRGLRNASLADDHWEQFLKIFLESLDSCNCYPQLAGLLEMKVYGKGAVVPYDVLPLAEELADHLWTLVDTGETDIDSSPENCLINAVDAVGGILTEFFLKAIARHKTEMGETWKELPKQSKERLRRILESKSNSGTWGRVILAGRLNMLFSWDSHWTSQSIIPLFNQNIDETQSIQAWSAYLIWGSPKAEILPLLLDHYLNLCKLVPSFGSLLRTRYAEHLAVVAIFSSINPLEHGWLNTFIQNSENEDRRNWAAYLIQCLASLDEGTKITIWNAWLCQYWSDRIKGKPVAISSEEVNEMVTWAIHLEPIFVEVVDKILISPPPKLEHTGVYRDIQSKINPHKHPDTLTRLLIYLLENTVEPFHDCKSIEGIVRQLMKYKQLAGDLTTICDLMNKLGCTHSIELAREIERIQADE